MDRSHLLSLSLLFNFLAAVYIVSLGRRSSEMSQQLMELVQRKVLSRAAPDDAPKVSAAGVSASLSPALLPSASSCSAEWAGKPPWLQYGCALGDWHAWVLGLKKRERKLYSQNGEDGITEAIFEKIGHGAKKFLEFGVEDGTQCNTRILREKHGWTGVMFDNNNHRPEIGLHKAQITLGNVMAKIREHSVPMDVDLFSLDINYADWFMLEVVMGGGLRPRVLIVEFNRNFDAFASVTVSRESVLRNETWTGLKYFGASPLAFAKLMRVFGYTLVAINQNGVNLFFVRDALLGGNDLALAGWVHRVAEGRQVPMPLHKELPRHRPHQQVCLATPCRDFTSW